VLAESVTQLAPRQADEYVFERDLAPGDHLHIRVVEGFAYQTRRGVETPNIPQVSARDATAYALRFTPRQRRVPDC